MAGSKVGNKNGKKKGPSNGSGAAGEPDLSHLPYGEPFAWKVEQLTRRPMNLEPSLVHEMEKKCVDDLQSEDVEVRRAAANRMRRYYRRASSHISMERLYKALFDPDMQVRMDVAENFKVLGSSDRFHVDPFYARLAQKLDRHSVASVFERILTLEALARIGEPVLLYFPAVLSHLLHEEWTIRLAAVNAINGISPFGARRVLEKLQRHDENMSVRKAADEVLRKRHLPISDWKKPQLLNWAVKNRKKQDSKRLNHGRVHLN